ncbi:MAG: tetratricopeptide repeat protein [Muribaculaceae bacterium]|nr:tetratricopeptide repeat protein [Muribaculaceae bacterium]
MKNLIATTFITLMTLLAGGVVQAQSLDINQQPQDESTQEQQAPQHKPRRSDAMQVRNYIKQGNKNYNDKRYSEAERDYQKALEIDPNSEVANFNLASALLQQNSNGEQEDPNSPLNRAVRTLNNLTKTAQNPEIVEKSYYNLGNIAYNGQNYSESIAMYKEVLRRNPANDKARENLRLAQKKLQEQQQNQQNQQQQQDQQQQQQDQQQNQDKQEEQKQDQQQQQNQQHQQQDQQQQDQQQQHQQMSDNNAEQILKAMENAEAETRRKIEAQKAREQQTNRRRPEKPW